MDVGRMASLYIVGTEEAVRGNDMIYVLTFERPIDHARLATSYEALVRANEPLRVRWSEAGDAFAWTAYGPEELEARLARERLAFAGRTTLEALYAAYSPTNERLPLRVEAIDDYRIALLVNHAWSNGYGGFFWLEHLLAAYEGAPATQVVDPGALAPRAPWIVRAWRAVLGTFWAIAYLVGFGMRAGKNAATETVDLARRTPDGARSKGHAVRTYHFTAEETKQVLARAKERGLSVAAKLAADVARAFFEAQPERSRICMSMPVDVGAYVDRFSRTTPGNFTGSLILQLRRGADLDRQVRRGLLGFRRGVPYWVTRLLASASKSERAALERFRTQARTAIPTRAPFENFTCAVSSVGVLRGPMLERHVTTIHGHTRTQTVFLVAHTLRGRLAFEVSVPRDLFDESEVFAVTDRARALLTEGSTSPAPARAGASGRPEASKAAALSS